MFLNVKHFPILGGADAGGSFLMVATIKGVIPLGYTT